MRTAIPASQRVVRDEEIMRRIVLGHERHATKDIARRFGYPPETITQVAYLLRRELNNK